MLINQHHLTVLDNVLNVFVKHRVGAQPGMHMVQQAQIGGAVEVVTLFEQPLLDHQFLDELVPSLGKLNLTLLFIDSEMTCLPLRFLLQERNQAIDALVKFRAVFGGTGYDKRRARFINQDGIDLVHDGKMQSALHALLE